MIQLNPKHLLENAIKAQNLCWKVQFKDVATSKWHLGHLRYSLSKWLDFTFLNKGLALDWANRKF